MTDTPNQPTGTAAEVLKDLAYDSVGVLPTTRHEMIDQAAHQLYLAELERIGDDEVSWSEFDGNLSVHELNPGWEARDQLRAELREKARLFYGQPPQTLEQLAKGTPFEGLIKGDSIK